MYIVYAQELIHRSIFFHTNSFTASYGIIGTYSIPRTIRPNLKSKLSIQTKPI